MTQPGNFCLPLLKRLYLLGQYLYVWELGVPHIAYLKFSLENHKFFRGILLNRGSYILGLLVQEK